MECHYPGTIIIGLGRFPFDHGDMDTSITGLAISVFNSGDLPVVIGIFIIGAKSVDVTYRP